MSDKLASTEQMFGTPYYCGLLVDQSIVFNRRRDGSQSAKVREEDFLYLFSRSKYINLYNDASLQERNPHDLLLSVPGNVDGDAGE